MSDETPAAFAKDDKGRFVTGNIGGGRPKGARNKLGEAFIEALHDDFNEHGAAAIVATRTDKPDQYLKVIASLLPKDINLNINDETELTDDELISRIRTLTEAVAPFLAGIGTAATGVEGEAGAQLTPRVH